MELSSAWTKGEDVSKTIAPSLRLVPETRIVPAAPVRSRRTCGSTQTKSAAPAALTAMALPLGLASVSAPSPVKVMLPPQPIESERMAASELLPDRLILKSAPIIVSTSTEAGAL